MNYINVNHLVQLYDEWTNLLSAFLPPGWLKDTALDVPCGYVPVDNPWQVSETITIVGITLQLFQRVIKIKPIFRRQVIATLVQCYLKDRDAKWLPVALGAHIPQVRNGDTQNIVRKKDGLCIMIEGERDQIQFLRGERKNTAQWSKEKTKDASKTHNLHTLPK